MSSQLEKFLLADVNSRTKESLINYKLFYDLKLSAALDGYDLSLYTPDVDRDGFDIILDDRDSVRKIQLKTVLITNKKDKRAATTSSWDIHKAILRPDMEFCSRLGFESSPFGVGVQGGVILILIDVSESGLSISYAYTDIFVITALHLGLVHKTPKIRKNVFENFYAGVKEGISSEKIAVPRSLFVDAVSPEHLLGLMSLHNRIGYGWWHHLLTIGENEYVRTLDASTIAVSLRILRGYVADELLKLTSGLSKPQP